MWHTLATLELSNVIVVSRISSRPKSPRKKHVSPELALQALLLGLLSDSGHLGWPGGREGTGRDVRKACRFGLRNLSQTTDRPWMLRSLHPLSHDFVRQAVVSFTLHQGHSTAKKLLQLDSTLQLPTWLRAAHLLWRAPLHADNICMFKSSGSCLFKTSRLKHKLFLFLYRSLNFPSVYEGTFSKNAPSAKQHRFYKSSHRLYPLLLGTSNPMYHNCWERLLSFCEITQIITACHVIHKMLFKQHNIYPYCHTFPVITADMKVNLSWKWGKKSLQNRTSHLPALRTCLPICTHHLWALPTGKALTLPKFLHE